MDKITNTTEEFEPIYRKRDRNRQSRNNIHKNNHCLTQNPESLGVILRTQPALNGDLPLSDKMVCPKKTAQKSPCNSISRNVNQKGAKRVMSDFDFTSCNNSKQVKKDISNIFKIQNNNPTRISQKSEL